MTADWKWSCTRSVELWYVSVFTVLLPVPVACVMILSLQLVCTSQLCYTDSIAAVGILDLSASFLDTIQVQ